MSNLVSGIAGAAMQSSAQRGLMATQLRDERRRERLATPSVRQSQFANGTLSLLDEGRNLVENATQQGQQLNPQIYQLLGMDPVYQDNTADLQSATDEFNAAQKQYDQAQQAFSQLQGIPPGKRSPAQQKQFKQLKKQMRVTTTALEAAKEAHGRLATMPKTITGFNRMDPSQIPASSPFSAQNPLFQIAHTEAERAQQALEGGLAVDPLLVHQWTQGEGALRAQLSSRYGPDYENSSVGQMALQDFQRRKSESFANWNYQKQQEYSQAAFQQQGQLQALTGGQIGLMREPSQWEANAAAQVAQQAGPRLGAQQTWQQYLLGRSGLGQGNIPGAPMPQLSSGGGLSQLLEQWNKSGATPTSPQNSPANIQPGYGGWQGAAGATASPELGGMTATEGASALAG